MKHSIRMFVMLVGILLTSSTVPALASAEPLSWTVSLVDGEYGMVSVSCPSESLCVAGDSAGNVVTSTNPTGGVGAWTVTNVNTNPEKLGLAIFGMSCASASLCVGGDHSGNVLASANPTGGAAAWSVAHVSPSGGEADSVTEVSCPSVSLCVAIDLGGNVITSTNPTGGAGAWSAAQVDNPGNLLIGISCPSVSLCVAVDSVGNVLTSTNPTGGAAAWTKTLVPGTYDGNGISCPSVSLCVFTDGNGNVVTSTNPTGGAGAWTVTNVYGDSLYGISCASVSFCVAVDGSSNVLTYEAGVPTVLNIETGGMFAISCPSTSLCVTTSGGSVVVGSSTSSKLSVNTSPPMVFGHAQVGHTLHCTPGTWSGSMPRTYTVQWQRDGSPISGASGTFQLDQGIYYAHYVAQAADSGHALTCSVTASNAAGSSVPAASAPTDVVAPAPAGEPEIGGIGTVQSPFEQGWSRPVRPSSPPVKCVVPKLKGKTLKKAKRLLFRSHCRLGKVSQSKKTSKPKVVRQKPRPGKTLPAESKVAIKLG